jgi:predicted nucleic acid-binding protein
MRVLLDTDVILDILLKRNPFQAEITSLRESIDTASVSFSVTSLTVANAYYICRKQQGSPGALKSVRQLLETFEVLPVDFKTLEVAASLPGPDFEDNVQIAAAMASGARAIVTRDQAGFSHSPLPVHSSQSLLAALREENQAK